MPSRGTIRPMGTIAARYDRSAARYERWWAPVLAPAALALLESVSDGLSGPPRRVVDIGTGTGVLARSAAARWSGTAIVAIDASPAMLGVAARESGRRMVAADRDRIEWRTALAHALPLDDASVDLAVSSFVMQLVPDRLAALREAHRILRPGGRLGYVTWLAGDDAFAPMEAFERIAEEMEDEVLEPEEARSGDPVSPAAAAAQLRRAGFRHVRARRRWLTHRWTARSYLAFLERYEAADLFAALDPERRRDLRAATQRALARLPADAFIWRVPIVEAIAERTRIVR
jgi:ubiquinone/menaquinone biosynthesis C-methylase UbiE